MGKIVTPGEVPRGEVCEPGVWCERESYERPAPGVDWAGRELPKGRRRRRAMPESSTSGAGKAMHRQSDEVEARQRHRRLQRATSRRDEKGVRLLVAGRLLLLVVLRCLVAFTAAAVCLQGGIGRHTAGGVFHVPPDEPPGWGVRGGARPERATREVGDVAR